MPTIIPWPGIGYRFFKDGHVQKKKITILCLIILGGVAYIRAIVLPSMVKMKKNSVRLCLTASGDVQTA